MDLSLYSEDDIHLVVTVVTRLIELTISGWLRQNKGRNRGNGQVISHKLTGSKRVNTDGRWCTWVVVVVVVVHVVVVDNDVVGGCC